MKSALNKERLYENLLASMEEGVIVLDREFSIMTFNQGAEEIAGVSESHAVGNELSTVLRGPEIAALAQKTRDTGKRFSDNNLSVKRRDGKTVPVAIAVTPLLDDDGTSLGTVIVLRDMSRIRTLEEDLRRSDRLGMLGTLAAGLAHEIKNPLGGIKGSAQLLQEELNGDERLGQYTGIIIREVDRVNRLIGELLDFTKAKNLSPKAVNIHKILEDVLLLMSGEIESRRIAVLKEFDPSLPAIRIDTEKMTQVFLNLIKNAVESFDKPGAMMIGTRIVTDYQMVENEEKKGIIIIEVADQGRGMNQETLENLFTPFFTTKDRGTGLGLAISHRIIKEHRGSIKVRSREGEGTIVSVSLPLN